MARGTTAAVGTERWSKNGYLYRKTENHGWQLVHRLTAEERLGRRLTENEYAVFKDGDKTNFDPDNIEVLERGRSSLRRRIAQLNARIEELTAQRDQCVARLELQESL